MGKKSEDKKALGTNGLIPVNNNLGRLSILKHYFDVLFTGTVLERICLNASS